MQHFFIRWLALTANIFWNCGSDKCSAVVIDYFMNLLEGFEITTAKCYNFSRLFNPSYPVFSESVADWQFFFLARVLIKWCSQQERWRKHLLKLLVAWKLYDEIFFLLDVGWCLRYTAAKGSVSLSGLSLVVLFCLPAFESLSGFFILQWAPRYSLLFARSSASLLSLSSVSLLASFLFCRRERWFK